jgi:hypothetical protein
MGGDIVEEAAVDEAGPDEAEDANPEGTKEEDIVDEASSRDTN